MALKTSIQRKSSTGNGAVTATFESLDNASRNTINDKITVSEWKMIDIPLNLLKPYPGNKLLRISKIDELAKSIHATRLINPIAVAKDSDGMYYILSGHRRAEAFKLLNSTYPEDKYVKIPGYVVSSRDSDDPEYLKKIWFDANFETRQLSIEDAVNNIEFFMNQLTGMDEDEKKLVIMELKGDKYSEDKYNTGMGKSRQINIAQFIYERFKELDIPGWSLSTIKNYLFVVNKGIIELKDAFLKSEIPLYIAMDIARHPKDEQLNLIQLFLTDPLRYSENKSDSIPAPSKQKNDIFVDEAKNIQRLLLKLNQKISLVNKDSVTLSDSSITAIQELRNYIRTLSNNIDSKLLKIEENH